VDTDWLVVSRGFFEAFPPAVDEAAVRRALVALGYPQLREVAPRLGPFLEGLLALGSPEGPAISAACPPANDWLRGEAPALASLLAALPSPAEVALEAAAGEARAEAAARGLRIRLLFVSPCGPKAAAMRRFAAELACRPAFALLAFEVLDLGPLRARVLAALGRDPGEEPGPEAPPRLPPGVLFVEGRSGLETFASAPRAAGVRAVLPFWCEGGCNGAALGN